MIIAVSVLAVMPEKMVDHDSGDIASELEISESVDGNVTSTSYVNTEGEVTDAIDMCRELEMQMEELLRNSTLTPREILSSDMMTIVVLRMSTQMTL